MVGTVVKSLFPPSPSLASPPSPLTLSPSSLLSLSFLSSPDPLHIPLPTTYLPPEGLEEGGRRGRRGLALSLSLSPSLPYHHHLTTHSYLEPSPLPCLPPCIAEPYSPLPACLPWRSVWVVVGHGAVVCALGCLLPPPGWSLVVDSSGYRIGRYRTLFAFLAFGAFLGVHSWGRGRRPHGLWSVPGCGGRHLCASSSSLSLGRGRGLSCLPPSWEATQAFLGGTALTPRHTPQTHEKHTEPSPFPSSLWLPLCDLEDLRLNWSLEPTCRCLPQLLKPPFPISKQNSAVRLG